MGALAAAGLAFVAMDVVTARELVARLGAKSRDFRAGVAGLPTAMNLVFVRYAPNRNMHLSLVANAGNLDGARTWIVHDRGADNRRLAEAAPDRTPYLYDEVTNTFTRMVP
jgi:hypothetical protein